MAVAPVVEYYRLVDDGTGMDVFQYEDPNNIVAASLLDFGTVDAGTNTYSTAYNGNNALLTASNNAVQAYAIYNNNSNSSNYVSSGVSDMQNATLSVVSNEQGQQGNSAGTVYEKGWIKVLLNNGVYGQDDDYLGLDPETPAEPEHKVELTAVGLSDAGTISGAANGGTVTANDDENFARVLVWVDIENNAPAGPHLFRLRTTYSYT